MHTYMHGSVVVHRDGIYHAAILPARYISGAFEPATWHAYRSGHPLGNGTSDTIDGVGEGLRAACEVIRRDRIENPPLRRGAVDLPHQSQSVKRDLNAELIRSCVGARAHCWRASAEYLRDCIDGKPGTGLPYEYLVRSPRSSALAWTAFYTWADLVSFCVAYGIEVPAQPCAGDTFTLTLPASDAGFRPLVGVGGA